MLWTIMIVLVCIGAFGALAFVVGSCRAGSYLPTLHELHDHDDSEHC